MKNAQRKTVELEKSYWILTGEYPPAFGGGIGTYSYQNARMLQKQGWEVTVFVPDRQSSQIKVRLEEGVRLVRFGITGSATLGFLGFDTALAYESAALIGLYLKKEGIPRILESQEYSGLPYFVLQYKHLNYPLFNQLRILLTLHAPSFLYHEFNRVPPYRLPYFWIGEMERWCILAADQCNVPSQYMTRAIKPFFSDPAMPEIPVLPYPFAPEAPASDPDTDPRDNWLFFGKLTPQKGIIPLLNTCRDRWQQGWTRKLRLIGGGDHLYHPEELSMENWIKETYRADFKLGRLRWHGNLAPDKWSALQEEGAVVVVPSLADNYPFTVLESMSRGQVVLASVQGGQSELICHGRNGFLFDHEVQGDLDRKIGEIENLSPPELKKIRLEAISSVHKRHDYRQVYPQKLDLINKLSTNPAPRETFPFTRSVKSDRKPPVGNNGKVPGLLSIVIPYHNMEAYLGEAIQSAAQSTFPNKEIIVIDDGSDPPLNESTLRELQSRSTFQFIRQNNAGLPETRNAGARAARGEFLAFLDADDIVSPTYYEKAIDILNKKKNVAFVGCWAYYFGRSKGNWPAFNPEPPYLLYYNMVCSGGLVYRTVSFLDAGCNDRRLEYGLEDWDSVISMVKASSRGVVIPESLYGYRIRKNSMSRKFTREKLLYSTRYIAEKHREFYSAYAAELTNLFNANGPGFEVSNLTLDYHSRTWMPAWIPFGRKLVGWAKQTPWVRRILFRLIAIIKK